MITLNQEAPSLLDHLDAPSQSHFDGLRRMLDAAQVAYVVNPRLVRGLDYYGLTVFEWITSDLGAQGTVCAGGRYDSLVEQLGGRATPAVGFALGLERLALLFAAQNDYPKQPNIYCVLMGQAAIEQGVVLAESLRHHLPQQQIITHLTNASLKSQLKAADKSGAQWAIIIGETELADQQATVKNLRGEQDQQTIAFSALPHFFKGVPHHASV